MYILYGVYIYMIPKTLRPSFWLFPMMTLVSTLFPFKMCVNINIRLVTIIDAMNHEINCTLAF